MNYKLQSLTLLVFPQVFSVFRSAPFCGGVPGSRVTERTSETAVTTEPVGIGVMSKYISARRSEPAPRFVRPAKKTGPAPLLALRSSAWIVVSREGENCIVAALALAQIMHPARTTKRVGRQPVSPNGIIVQYPGPVKIWRMRGDYWVKTQYSLWARKSEGTPPFDATSTACIKCPLPSAGPAVMSYLRATVYHASFPK